MDDRQDGPDQRVRQKGPKRMRYDRFSGQTPVLFWNFAAHPRATAGSDDDRGDPHKEPRHENASAAVLGGARPERNP
jgi:hypothetical protein